MRYLSVTEIAKKWGVSERSVRNYCAQGRVIGAFLTGKTWNIPENAEKPERTNRRKEEPITLLDILDFRVKFEQIHPFQDDGVIIGTRLGKPSKINGFALLSPIFLSHAGWREDGAVHINTYYTESQMGLCA